MAQVAERAPASRWHPFSLPKSASVLWIAAFGLVTVVAVAVQTWAALQWTANFDADEAVFGLMARHILQGQIPVYMYGQAYLGSLDSILSAPFMVLAGSSAVTLRLSSLLMFAAFFICQILLVRQLWGNRIAFMSAAVLAFPGWTILWWTYRPSANFAAMMALGTLALLLNVSRLPAHQLLGPKAEPPLRAGIIGLCIGIGLWTHPMTFIYCSIIGIVFLLQSNEWRLCYHRIEQLCQRFLNIPARELLPVLSLSAGGLVVLAMFTTSCQPAIPFGIAQSGARLILIVTAAAIAIGAFVLSPRRKSLALGSLALGSGFLLGNSPQWLAWLRHGIAPSTAVWPTCPPDALGRVELVTTELLPLTWGLPALATVKLLPPSQAAPWMVMFALMLVALALVFWRERIALWSLLALKPLSREHTPGVMLGTMFMFPVLLALLSGNTIGMWATRYFLISWQASAILLAIFLVWIARYAPRISYLLLVAWLLYVGMGNLREVGTLWHQRAGWFAPAAVAEFTAFVEQQKVVGGYADYLIAYPLSFLTNEMIILAPYNGIDRYKAYSTQIEAMAVRAFVFCRHCLPLERSSIDDLANGLRVDRNFGPAWPHLLTSLEGKEVLNRRQVGHWDIWIVGSRQ